MAKLTLPLLTLALLASACAASRPHVHKAYIGKTLAELPATWTLDSSETLRGSQKVEFRTDGNDKLLITAAGDGKIEDISVIKWRPGLQQTKDCTVGPADDTKGHVFYLWVDTTKNEVFEGLGVGLRTGRIIHANFNNIDCNWDAIRASGK